MNGLNVSTFDPPSYIRELRQTITQAGVNYEVWWVFKSEDTRREYIDAMNKYTIFFETSLHAHFVAMIVALYRLYEIKSRHLQHSIVSAASSETRTFEHAILTQLDIMYNSARPLWKKVCIIRNNAFGHRSVTKTIAEIFEDASINGDDIEALIKHTEELLNVISRAWDRSTYVSDLGARGDLIQLLTDIRRDQIRSGKLIPS